MTPQRDIIVYIYNIIYYMYLYDDLYTWIFTRIFMGSYSRLFYNDNQGVATKARVGAMVATQFLIFKLYVLIFIVNFLRYELTTHSTHSNLNLYALAFKIQIHFVITHVVDNLSYSISYNQLSTWSEC